MSDDQTPQPVPDPAPLATRGRVGSLFRLLLLVLLLVGGGGYVFATQVIDLRYQGEAPAVEVVIEGFAEEAIATEGVAVSPDGQVYVATGTGEILRLHDDGSTSVFVDLSGLNPEGERDAICQIAFAPNGDLYVAHFAHGVFRLVKPDGTASIIDENVVGPNFVVWHPAGFVFLTDSEDQVLYRYNPDGSNRTVIMQKDAITYPNGFALTADGQALLVNSTDSGLVYRIDLTAELDAAGPPRQVANFGTGFWKKPLLDGMLRIGADDFLVCDYFGSQLLRVSEAGTVHSRYPLGTALNGRPITPASLAQTSDGTIYVSNLGNIFMAAISPDHWGRGFYRLTLPPLEG